MSLYNAKSAYEFHKIIKDNYKQYSMLVMKMNANIENIKTHLLMQMPTTRFLNYSFATDYLHQCKYYYKITCQDSVFHIVSKSRPNIKNICKSINSVMLVKNLYAMQKPLEYFILLNPKKRCFPKNGCMQAQHINGGFTNPQTNQIYIIRKQEYMKVMIHELLHHNKYINKDDWNHNNILRLKTYFNIDKSCKFYPNEAVVETFACMIYTCLISIERGISFREALKKEMNHSCLLSNKIIRMQNKKDWYEETNSYCYIVLKCIFFCHLSKFMKIYDNENLLTNMLMKHKIPKYAQDVKSLKLLHHQ